MRIITSVKSYKAFKFLDCSFWKNTKGATAVEFALIAPVFFSLVFSALELGFLTAKATLLDLAASETSKAIYIGSVNSGSVSVDDLKDQICDRVSILDSDCINNITVELTPIADFDALPTTDVVCRDSDVVIQPVVTFTPGTSNETVFMRICLTTNVYFPGIGFGLNMNKTETGKTQIVSSIAFANEPF